MIFSEVIRKLVDKARVKIINKKLLN